MQNLQLIYAVKKRIHNLNPKLFILGNDQVQNAIAAGTGTGGEDILYLYSNNKILSFNLKTNAIEELFDITDVVNCEYLTLNNEICIATENGEVLTLNLNTKKSEIQTLCEDGLIKMQWSPDQEVCVFVTKTKKVVVMTSTYEPINETDLNDVNFGENEFITVGWGKKETQFHGSEGKKAAKEKTQFVEPKEIDQLNDMVINVTWRGDSELFAVSYFGINGRMFKVFNKEGVLQYTSERLNGLGNCISWKPSGSLIAVPHQLPNKSTIGLFEKNGLRHHEIVLPFDFKDESVTNLLWNTDSDILAIQTELQNTNRLYLYTISNYLWYLKQFLKFNCKIMHFTWSIEMNENKTLHILLEDGNYLVYRWCYTICSSEGNSQFNQSVVSVIFGNKILLTDFHNNIIPPPMCKQTIENSSNINYCGFIKHPKKDKNINRFFIFDGDNQIKIFDMKFKKNPQSTSGKYQLKSIETLSCLIPEDDDQTSSLSSIPLDMNKLIMLNDNSILFYDSYDQDKNSNQIGLIKFINNKNYRITDTIKIPTNDIIGNIINLNSTEFLVQTKTGEIYRGQINDDNTMFVDKPKLFTVIPEFCEYIKCIKLNDQYKIIGYKLNKNLYLNNMIIASDVTSFFITEKYIIFTQLNYIKFWKITDNQIMDEQKIERGGKLITIISSNSFTILQMPRGNLEMLQPRILLLDTISYLLNNLQYFNAIEIAIKNRINLNIIIDHDPKLFLENIEKFLIDIKNINWLNIFINDLKNEDLTITTYTSNYSNLNKKDLYPENYQVNDKISYICKLLCKKMMKMNMEYYMLAIITCYVKMNDVESALKIIWNERLQEQNHKICIKKNNNNDNDDDDDENDDDDDKFYNEDEILLKRSEKAIKYLICLIDINDLYDIALGMYDYNLILMIANKSQKDPKEYLKFLNYLKRYDINYRKYKIDEHLRRYERALENLVKSIVNNKNSTKDNENAIQNDENIKLNEKRFEECLEFIERHELYQKAVKEFENHDEIYYKRVCIFYADYLRVKSKHKDASMMYQFGGDLEQAISSAKHILDWQRCLMLTKMLKKSNDDNDDDAVDELRNISISLIPGLQEHGKYEDAFYLLKTFVNDFPKALQCLLDGQLYVKAIFEARINSPDLIDLKIQPHLLDYSELLRQNILSDKKLFLEYKNRLILVRDEIKKQNEIEQNHENDGCIDECDLLSDTTSVNSTRSSERSGRTVMTISLGKNRRKFERKMFSLKRGNPLEDLALINAIYDNIQKIMDLQRHIHDVCKSLIELNLLTIGKCIQNEYKKLLSTIKNSLNEIWIQEMLTTPSGDIDQLIGQNVDYIKLFTVQRYAMLPPQKKYKPQLDFIDWEFKILE